MTIIWILVGVAVGYFGKKQIDFLLGRVMKKLRDRQNGESHQDDSQNY